MAASIGELDDGGVEVPIRLEPHTDALRHLLLADDGSGSATHRNVWVAPPQLSTLRSQVKQLQQQKKAKQRQHVNVGPSPSAFGLPSDDVLDCYTGSEHVIGVTHAPKRSYLLVGAEAGLPTSPSPMQRRDRDGCVVVPLRGMASLAVTDGTVSMGPWAGVAATPSMAAPAHAGPKPAGDAEAVVVVGTGALQKQQQPQQQRREEEQAERDREGERWQRQEQLLALAAKAQANGSTPFAGPTVHAERSALPGIPGLQPQSAPPLARPSSPPQLHPRSPRHLPGPRSPPPAARHAEPSPAAQAAAPPATFPHHDVLQRHGSQHLPPSHASPRSQAGHQPQPQPRRAHSLLPLAAAPAPASPTHGSPRAPHLTLHTQHHVLQPLFARELCAGGGKAGAGPGAYDDEGSGMLIDLGPGDRLGAAEGALLPTPERPRPMGQGGAVGGAWDALRGLRLEADQAEAAGGGLRLPSALSGLGAGAGGGVEAGLSLLSGLVPAGGEAEGQEQGAEVEMEDDEGWRREPLEDHRRRDQDQGLGRPREEEGDAEAQAEGEAGGEAGQETEQAKGSRGAAAAEEEADEGNEADDEGEVPGRRGSTRVLRLAGSRSMGMLRSLSGLTATQPWVIAEASAAPAAVAAAGDLALLSLSPPGAVGAAGARTGAFMPTPGSMPAAAPAVLAADPDLAELLKLKVSLRRAVQAGNSPAVALILSLLAALPVCAASLAGSGVGELVGPLQSSANAAVAAGARHLVTAWKALLRSTARRAAAPTQGPAPQAQPQPPLAPVPAPVPATAPAVAGLPQRVQRQQQHPLDAHQPQHSQDAAHEANETEEDMADRFAQLQPIAAGEPGGTGPDVLMRDLAPPGPGPGSGPGHEDRERPRSGPHQQHLHAHMHAHTQAHTQSHRQRAGSYGGAAGIEADALGGAPPLRSVGSGGTGGIGLLRSLSDRLGDSAAAAAPRGAFLLAAAVRSNDPPAAPPPHPRTVSQAAARPEGLPGDEGAAGPLVGQSSNGESAPPSQDLTGSPWRRRSHSQDQAQPAPAVHPRQQQPQQGILHALAACRAVLDSPAATDSRATTESDSTGDERPRNGAHSGAGGVSTRQTTPGVEAAAAPGGLVAASPGGGAAALLEANGWDMDAGAQQLRWAAATVATPLAALLGAEGEVHAPPGSGRKRKGERERERTGSRARQRGGSAAKRAAASGASGPLPVHRLSLPDLVGLADQSAPSDDQRPPLAHGLMPPGRLALAHSHALSHTPAAKRVRHHHTAAGGSHQVRRVSLMLGSMDLKSGGDEPSTLEGPNPGSADADADVDSGLDERMLTSDDGSGEPYSDAGEGGGTGGGGTKRRHGSGGPLPRLGMPSNRRSSMAVGAAQNGGAVAGSPAAHAAVAPRGPEAAQGWDHGLGGATEQEAQQGMEVADMDADDGPGAASGGGVAAAGGDAAVGGAQAATGALATGGLGQLQDPAVTRT